MQTETKTAEHRITTPLGDVHLKTWSNDDASPQKTPIVLLHDSLGCVEMWRDFPSQLLERTGHPVIAYDRLGFGRSAKRESRPSIRFVAEESETSLPFIFDFARKRFGGEKVSLFGHSVGGAMTAVAASKLAAQIECVVTESAQAYVEERTREGIRQAKANFEDPKVLAKLERYHGDKAKWVLDAWTEVWLSSEFSNWSLLSEMHLAKPSCPFLTIHGDLDEYGSTDFPKTIASLTTGFSQVEILQNVGHVPHRENPSRILDLVADFFARSVQS